MFPSDSSPGEVPVERHSSFWHVIDDALLDMKWVSWSKRLPNVLPNVLVYTMFTKGWQSKPRLAKVHGTLSFSDPKAQAGRSLKPKGFAWWVRSRKDTNKAQPATNILVHSKYYHISSYISKTAKMELMRTHMWGKCRRFPALPSGTTLTGNEGSTSQDGCSSNSVDMLAFWCFWHEDTCTNLNLVESLSFFVEHDLCDLKFLFHERQFRRDVQHCHAIIFAI